MNHSTDLAPNLEQRFSQQATALVSWRALLGLWFSLCLPSISIVHKYFRIEGVLVYLVVATTVLYIGHWKGVYARIAPTPSRAASSICQG